MARRLKSERATVSPPPPRPTRKHPRKGTVNLRNRIATQSKAELTIQALLHRGAAARTSIEDFYRLVIREEFSKAPLEPAPHQKVMFSFVEHHPRVVFRQPIGTGKTFGMGAITLWLLGNDVTVRGCALSKTTGQAAKILKMVSDYITEPSLNKPLILAFPHLQKSNRNGDPWTTTNVTVDRPPGIRDPSLAAVGLETAIQGSRISWLVADDTIDMDNSSTPEARSKAIFNLEGQVLSRLDPKGSKAAFTNTPWDREDLTYYLEEKCGWPTLQMDIYGNIRVTNADAAWLHMAEQKYIRPSTVDPDGYRLRAFDPDPNEETPLWPERMSLAEIEDVRKRTSPHQFARMYLCEPFDADASRCHRDWVEKCKLRGIGTSLVHTYDGPNPVFTGLDLSIGTGGKHDLSVFFTIELMEDGSRKVLNIESGRFSGPKLVDMIGDMHERYGAIVIVENNAAQDFIRQFAQEAHKNMIIKAHTTTSKNKLHEDFGVESIFTELSNGTWIIPCDLQGNVHPEVKKWIDNMLMYMPHKHTGDHLMASWIARERARRNGRRDATLKLGAPTGWARASAMGGF